MNRVKQIQDIHIEPLKISYVGSKNVLSEKNKSDLIKILTKHQVFDNQLFKMGTLSISTERAVLLLQTHNKKLNISHLDDLSVAILARRVNTLAHKLLITEPKQFGSTELIDPLTDAISLPVTFSLKFIHSFENALVSSAKISTSASSIALVSDAVRDYKQAARAHNDFATRFALFQGLYGTIQGILGAEALSLTFVNLIKSNMTTLDALTYTGAISAALTVAYLNIRSAFNLYHHNKIMSPITNILKNESLSEPGKQDQIAQYLEDKVSITSDDIENTYKHALESYKQNKHPTLLPKADKYLFILDEWYDKNLQKLLDGSETDPVRKLEMLEDAFKISLANELVTIHENKIGTFEKYMGSTALRHVQSKTLSNKELVETILKEGESFRLKQYVVITLSILAAACLATATITTGGIAIASSVIFVGILTLVAYSDIASLLSKLKDHMLTEKEKIAMELHVASSLLILATTVGIGIAMGAAAPILISSSIIAIFPLVLYAYILWEADRQLEKQVTESTLKILSNSL